MTARLLILLTVLFAAPQAFARADLTVDLQGPAAPLPDVMARYDVTVDNIGNRTANDVIVGVALPETHTSPTVHVLGTLGAIDSACALQDTHLTCNLGRLRRGASATLSFELALPVSRVPHDFVVEAKTSSREDSVANNALSYTQSLSYVATPIAGPRAALVRHCTGQDLVSFFECLLYPSSQSSHALTLEANGTLTFANAPPGYTGTWAQPTPDRLVMTYTFNNAMVAAFRGFGQGNDCFSGITAFPQSPGYIAAYQVCLQP